LSTSSISAETEQRSIKIIRCQYSQQFKLPSISITSTYFILQLFFIAAWYKSFTQCVLFAICK
jgi:hypothetical protein